MNELKIITLGVTNCYILKCNEGYVVIDTCFQRFYDRFITGLDKLGIELDNIKYLILTHHHNDHTGFAAALKKATGCRVIAHENAVLPLQTGKNEETVKPLNFRVRLVFAIFGGKTTFEPVIIGNDDIVIRGETKHSLRDIGINGDVIYTPGHTGDSISIVLDDGKALVGDLVMNFLKFTGTQYRPVFIDSQSIVFESWKKLIQLGAKEIYPAHGSPISVKDLQMTLDRFDKHKVNLQK